MSNNCDLDSYFDFSESGSNLPSNSGERYADSLVDSPSSFKFPDLDVSRLLANEQPQFTKASIPIHFDSNVDDGNDLKYQIASNNDARNEAPSDRVTIQKKKIQKLRKRDSEVQVTTNRRKNVPKHVDNDERAHPLQSCSCDCPSYPQASRFPAELLTNNPMAAISEENEGNEIPKNALELCQGYTMRVIEKAAPKSSEILGLAEVIEYLGADTITAEYESILKSVKDFRAEQRRSHGSVKAFLSQDRNSRLIKGVFCRIFTPGSASLQNYLLTARRMKEANRRALQNPVVLEKLRREMEDGQEDH